MEVKKTVHVCGKCGEVFNTQRECLSHERNCIRSIFRAPGLDKDTIETVTIRLVGSGAAHPDQWRFGMGCHGIYYANKKIDTDIYTSVQRGFKGAQPKMVLVKLEVEDCIENAMASCNRLIEMAKKLLPDEDLEDTLTDALSFFTEALRMDSEIVKN